MAYEPCIYRCSKCSAEMFMTFRVVEFHLDDMKIAKLRMCSGCYKELYMLACGMEKKKHVEGLLYLTLVYIVQRKVRNSGPSQLIKYRVTNGGES